MRRQIRFITAAATVALALSGCSINVSPNSEATGTDGTGSTVTILTHDSFQITEEQIADFETKTGYKLVTTAPGDAGFVVNQLLLGKDAPTVDGVFGIDNFSATTIADADVLSDYQPAGLPESAADYAVGDALIPIDHGQVCINIDRDWFAEHGVDEPTSLDQLTDPEYAKLLVITDPSSSSPGLAFLAGVVTKYGDGWQDYISNLLEGGTRVAAGWSDAYYSDFSGSEGKGDYPLVLSYASSPAAEDGKTSNLEASCVDQIEYAGVVADAKNPEGAQAFIDYLLSDDYQATIPEQMYMYPVSDQVALPEQWAKHAQPSSTPIEVDPARVAAERESWLNDFAKLSE
ncbi:thiamine ABC transporter substrate-binding protein [uncultured Gulosibacter sp.]|uniref:thiamine ABC transporter substrate-binding protein n=1 Tax=uncultured Gulosibacter sp. TaxID=1339167 RepID=UPI00288A78A2|nr:thiamine ABC transporter substrate-binding protein [uncultured Gulosibacter sp.]